MKRLVVIALVALLATSLTAETVLICHAQSLPATNADGFQSGVSQTLVDMVFDKLFDKGDIAFDTAMKDESVDPSAQWLSNLSRSYGASKVVYFRVYWKAGKEKEVLLDHVSYQLVGPKGDLLKGGNLTAALVASSSNEVKDSRALGNLLVNGLTL
ncbi:MAG: hypothetical protein WCG80_11560 [Spirochaetales bacterium]